MHTNLSVFSLLVCLSFLLCGCPKDGPEQGIIPVEKVSKAFADKYPDARNIMFDIEGDYYIATFTNDGYPTTAWFTDQGQWVMDKVKYPFSLLPLAVTDAFWNGTYGDWEVEECFVIHRAGMGTVYKIETEKGESEMDVYYSASGELIKAVQDDKNDDWPLYGTTIKAEQIKK